MLYTARERNLKEVFFWEMLTPYSTSSSNVAGPVDLSRNVALPLPSLLLSTSVGGFFRPDLPKFIPSKEFRKKTSHIM